MKKIIFLLLSILGCTQPHHNDRSVNIIPRPTNITEKEGGFLLTSNTIIISSPETLNEAYYLSAILGNSFGKIPLIETEGDSGIILKLNSELKSKTGDEGYVFTSSPQNIIIEAATPSGIFYGIQTLRQLLPPDFEHKRDEKKSTTITALEIYDKPRFSWRAFMLDEARYFKGVNTVKLLLEQMALHKMNIFHWHLVDDQGWRIEIKKYPKLTKIGSKRKNSMLNGWDSNIYSGIPHEGFYTQEEIRDIVQYATERHITIIPEMEMPGHCTAAIVSYPWIGTSGEFTDVPCTFGGGDRDIYNISDPKVEQFLKDILVEFMDLFPSKVIHIGGDEVDFSIWKNSQKVMDYMRNNKLNSPADLQINFTNKMSNFIESHDRRMMGWNDILGGASIHDYHSAEDVKTSQTLAANSIIHFWKGDLKLVTNAAERGYDIVNSLHTETYLDYTHKRLSLKKAYNFDPIPKGLDSKYHNRILGLGCQMWGEWIPTQSRMEYQVFPRLSAYAEVGWSDKSLKNYKNFSTRLESMKKRWKVIGIKFTDMKND